MTRKEIAMQYFYDGYNCAQAVVLAFFDVADADKETLVKISSSFGGGIGRLREVCGTVSGMAMVLGLLYGYDDAADHDKKTELYEKIQTLAKEFEKENGSIVCRELLGGVNGHSHPTPDKRTDEYYKKRPCAELVGMAAEMLEKFIYENPIPKGEKVCLK
ncbi:MAG: C_GCAxxG_C_C family protein [Clostridia bacterium]|nr:C_GCAxxG_C_C family protein [Clostridia bacterium]